MEELLKPQQSNWIGKLMTVGLIYSLLLLWTSLISFGYSIVWPRPPVEFSYPSAATIFTGLLIAPLVEEIVYRLGPITVARHFNLSLLPVILVSSVMFAEIHAGGYFAIPIQGVAGLGLSAVYARHGYWPSVILHTMWNFTYYFGIIDFQW